MRCRTFLFSCLLSISAVPCIAQPDWCIDADYFTTSVREGVITILHHSALYNCCPDHFSYSVAQQDTSISVLETEVFGEWGGCACLCCFDIPVPIGPVSAGRYRIEFVWHDYETGERTAILDVIVPDRGQQGEPARSDLIVAKPPCQQSPPAGVDPGIPAGPGLAAGSLSAVLLGSCPNPTRDSAAIEYELRSEGLVRLDVFHAGGTRIRVLVDGVVAAGRHRATWDGKDDAGSAVPAGVYFLRLVGAGTSSQERLVVVH
jgi:hypothetical protein